ncbi:hypothetical protein PRZ48_015037 [Zasmidium cellare]|uniref:Uncharacterized protein n=1 Tax=Zasmidium cellare TaxID=395010 RepID=A0ABR0DXJ3_ZASCE|nr:hypothetical protein PRZ48_015037 [Zasmidium cellare]
MAGFNLQGNCCNAIAMEPSFNYAVDIYREIHSKSMIHKLRVMMQALGAAERAWAKESREVSPEDLAERTFNTFNNHRMRGVV